MKTNIITFLFCIIALLVSMPIYAQEKIAKKATIMVVPSDIYCIRKGYYYLGKDSDGKEINIIDYKKAFQTDANLRLVISAINTYMAEIGYPLKDLEETIKGLEVEAIEQDLGTGKDGAKLEELPIDIYNRRAQADITLDIDFNINQFGADYSFSLDIKPVDAYTKKQLPGINKEGKGSISATIRALILENMYSDMTDFHANLQRHFDDLLKNGREVVLEFGLVKDTHVDSVKFNYDKEYIYDGEEKQLTDIIDEWLRLECVKGVFNVQGARTQTGATFIARIPMFDSKDRAIDARNFMQIFRKKLKESPYNLSASIYQRGLGHAQLSINGKISQ